MQCDVDYVSFSGSQSFQDDAMRSKVQVSETNEDRCSAPWVTFQYLLRFSVRLRKATTFNLFFSNERKDTLSWNHVFFIFFKKWPLGWSRATVMMMQCRAVAVILEWIPRWWIPVSVAGNMFMCRVLVKPCRVTQIDFSVAKHILYKRFFNFSWCFFDFFSLDIFVRIVWFNQPMLRWWWRLMVY